MGQSPSADLYFGYDLGGPEDDDPTAMPEWMDNGDDWEDVLARRLGWVEAPFPDDYPQGRSHVYRFGTDEYKAAREADDKRVTEYKATSPKYLAYEASRAEKDRLLATVPVELDTYGYLDGDSPYAMRVVTSVQRAYDYGSIRLNPLVEAEEWRDHLARFIELLGFDLGDKQPGWHLNCSYG
ncbi:hypothetical protein [Nocardia fluminea]|uniref:hypothetical protein n=1 Tax=Nocardia fluminea TaxID=134984 RepID=UPI003658095C